MSRSDTERCAEAFDDARDELLHVLSDAVTPGVDIGRLVRVLDQFIIARVRTIADSPSDFDISTSISAD